jgi:serine/threonine-protein kinase
VSPKEHGRATITASPDKNTRSTRSTALHTEAASNAHPDAFGSFRVLHQIGAGALGPVFRAYNPDQDRLVAVKLFRLDLTPERVHKLVAQLQTLIDADLTHAAIAAPVATGIADVAAFLALDFVAAESADVVARELGRVSVSDAVRIATQLAGALEFAIDANVAHGALHPRDVLVTPDDTRLTGLGIVQVLERLGLTPPVRRPYTAPERAAGMAWDRRADVFSLAAIAHELMWGRRISGIGQQAAAALTPLEGADLSRLRDLFAQALAENPSDRIESPMEFADGLRRALTVGAGTTIVTRSQPSSMGAISREPHEIEVRPNESLTLSEREDVDDRDATPPDMPMRAPVSRVDVREAELRLPLDDGEVSGRDVQVGRRTADRDADIDVARVFEAPLRDEDTVLAESVADLELAGVGTVENPAMASPTSSVSDDRASAQPRATRPVVPRSSTPSLFDGPGSALDRTRSAVWPLTLALGVGLAVGFALGYTVAGRGASEPTSGEGTAASAPVAPPVAFPQQGVAETEVRLRAESPVVSNGPEPTRMLAPPGDGPGSSDVAPVRLEPDPPGAEDRLKLKLDSARAVGAAVPAAPAGERQAPSPGGRLLIRSTPSGATAFLDGRDVGTTPLTLRSVEPGAHTVRVLREGFGSQEQRVAVTAERPSHALTFELAPIPQPQAPGPTIATIIVESRPSGASVLLDGRNVGKTPLTLGSVSAGAHTVSIEQAGYRRWTTTIRVTGPRHRVAASLEPQ